MSIAAVLVFAVTVLVAAIVALTYLKPHLLQPQEAGLPPRIHLYAGAAGLVVWVLFLVSPASFFLGGDVPGVIGLFGIWLAAIAGLYLLTRRLKEQRAHAAGREDAYGYDDGYGEEYADEDGYGYDESDYAVAGYDDYADLDDRAAYADPRHPLQQPVARPVAQPVPQPGQRADRQPERRPERRRAASSVDETAVMAPIEREASPVQPPAPTSGQPRGGQVGRRVAGREAPPPPAPQPPAPQRQAPAQPAPERSTQPRPEQGSPGRSQSGQDPWGRRQEPPQRRQRGYDGRYDDRRNDRHDEFADQRYRRDSSYSDYPGQPQPAPPRAPRPAPQPAPQPAPAPPPPPQAPTQAPSQAPSQRPGRRAQQPEAYDPYSLESYGPRDRAEPPAQPPRPPQAQPRRRQQNHGYDEQAYAGYEHGYDQELDQGYDYDQAYDPGYDDRYDDAYDRSVGDDRRERRRAFFEGSGAAIVAHITLVILAIWLTWAYGTSVI